MSFTSSVKLEVSKIENTPPEYISELSAIFKNIAVIEDDVKVTTENSNVARRIFNLIKNIYGVNPSVTVRRGYNFNKNYIYIIEFKNNKELVLENLDIIKNGIINEIPSDYIIGDENLLKSYLRGLFLACGSINDPKKSRYHLEFVVDTENYARYVSKLLNRLDLNSKYLKRDNKYMIYVKESEKISDFLKVIGATNAVMYFENIRAYRDQKNMTNRLNNCEQANVDKMIETANNQLKDIKLIKEEGLLDVLDEKLKVVAIYREKYPETSLKDLSSIITIETGDSITKSGLHHRLKKIHEIANRIRKKD
jgi:DNA-binding protein WhiA